MNGDKGRSEMLSINKTIAETKAKLSSVKSELKQLDGKIPENKEKIVLFFSVFSVKSSKLLIFRRLSGFRGEYRNRTDDLLTASQTL